MSVKCEPLIILNWLYSLIEKKDGYKIRNIEKDVLDRKRKLQKNQVILS